MDEAPREVPEEAGQIVEHTPEIAFLLLPDYISVKELLSDFWEQLHIKVLSVL
ncbi:DUF3898 domain-containing protein [Bacillus toyonensis]|uniref:DUF3898 domain-containing protein n=1 Tax=Bacillus toyonensis TaxID=155322 RepID=UPI000D033639